MLRRIRDGFSKGKAALLRASSTPISAAQRARCRAGMLSGSGGAGSCASPPFRHGDAEKLSKKDGRFFLFARWGGEKKAKAKWDCKSCEPLFEDYKMTSEVGVLC